MKFAKNFKNTCYEEILQITVAVLITDYVLLDVAAYIPTHKVPKTGGL